MCETEKTEDKYFKNQWSDLFKISDGHPLYCKDCINKDFEKMSNRYGSEKIALKIWCYKLDIPFYESLFESITENNSNFGIGMYLRILNNRQYQYKTFLNSIVDGELSKTDNEVKEEIESRWKKEDKQNMSYAISIVGYDPFDDSNLSQNDRKFLFNNLAGYCTDNLRNDNHKIQSIIQIVQSQLQCRKLDDFINLELFNVHPDDKRIKDLASTKKMLLDGIAKTAQDNNLSSNYNDNSSRGANTLSKKLKDMMQDDYFEGQVNMFSIKTADAMKQIADLSNKSILEQLSFDANDYSEMIKEQREMIRKFEEIQGEISEENRMLKNKVQDLETKKKKAV